MPNKKLAIGIGEILWDIFPDRKVLGGAPANFAYHISQWGMDGMIVSAIGDDALGLETIRVLEDKKVDYLLQTVGSPTGTVTVAVDEQGVARYNFAQDSAWDHLTFTDRLKQLAEEAQVVSFGTLAQRCPSTREMIRQFIGNVSADTVRLLDLNLRQDFYTKELIADSLKMASWLKINEEELFVLQQLFGFSGEETAQLGQIKTDFELDGIIYTKGTEGSFILCGENMSFLPALSVEVVDTVGAGDSFTAAFLAAHLRGIPLLSAHALAVEVSAYVCTRPGAMPEIPESLKLKMGRL